MNELAIDVKGLTKRFGSKVAVDHIDIAVPKGEVWGFLGPNGSGKTTTIRMLCGLLTADDGNGTCLGLDIRTQPEKIKRQVGYMTQRFSFWEDLSIRENLEFVARLYELKDRKARVDKSLERLGLVQRQHQLAAHLSGGWKQRMALGRLPAARAATVAAGRTDGRRRPQGAARFLGADPCPQRPRPHRAGLHPLYGRGRTLRPHRLYPQRQAGGDRHRGRSDRTLAA